jgi:nitroreductase
MKRFLENSEMIEVLNQRYATKRFEKRDIDHSELEDIVTSILQLTPTSFGLQAYKFIVVKDEATRSELRKHSWDQGQVTDSDMYVVFTVPTNFNASYIKKYMDHMQEVRDMDDEKRN